MKYAFIASIACLVAGPAVAQVGPIQPVLVLEDGKVETPHKRPDLPESYSIPVDVFVAADGSVSNVVVTDSSKNLDADQLAAEVMRSKRFLPALNAKGEPVAGMTRVTVAMFQREKRNVVKVVVKPPASNAETDRVKKMMCADFLWEVNRLRKEADVRDTSLEVMPFHSARMYMEQKRVPEEIQEKFWDAWPKQLKKVVAACEKDELKFFYAEVLVPALDGVLPVNETMSASAE
jgi:TonB family protein